jgi:hypothetical protein
VHVPPLCPCQRAGVQRRCAELRRLQRRLTVANAHVVMLVVLVVRPVKLRRRILRTAQQHAENHAVAQPCRCALEGIVSLARAAACVHDVRGNAFCAKAY